VLFDFDRAELKPDATGTLERIAEVLRFYGSAPVSIRGHTDSIGPDAYNDDLSRRRALAVRDYFVGKHRIDPARLQAVGHGKRRPVVPNTRPDGSDDPAGREKNRRVEVVIEGVRR
jgi:photosystem I P700 chlorophyll a apoprotein A2